jgi:outer membrane protein OmpA-like peptidoglycan-associated protein
MKLKILFCLLILLKALPSWSCGRDTTRLFFYINQSALSSRHKATLDSLSHLLSDTTAVQIRGFADYLGKRDSNYTLSKARAETVKNYLLILHSKNVRMVAEGWGQVDAATKNISALGEPFNRRVDIIVAKAAPKNQIAVKAIPADKITIKARPVDRITALISREPISEKRKDDSVYTRISDLPKLKIGDSVSFKELTFQPGRHFLRRAAVPYMVALKDCLRDHPSLKIEIQGHICCQNDGKDGLDFDTNKNNLSVNRAKFIYDYLVSEKINADRLRYKGLGSKEPKIFPELSAEDQNQNRRVVIVLLAK